MRKKTLVAVVFLVALLVTACAPPATPTPGSSTPRTPVPNTTGATRVATIENHGVYRIEDGRMVCYVYEGVAITCSQGSP